MNKAVKIIAIAVVVAFGVSVASVASADIDVNKLWSKNCAACHGKTGKGDTKAGAKMGVKDLSDAAVKAELNKDAVIKLITEGIVNEETGKPKMKSYKEKLSAEEIAALADHALAF